ncbi:MAG: lysophospholipase [Polaromonas sp.]|nr:lysophospholipase [Polaromonas sp.]
MSSTTISTAPAPFTARDGENLALYEWPLDVLLDETGPGAPPRGVVLLVHGLGEHASRYEHVAQQLMDWGFAVRAYDQRGHGESGGARGVIPDDAALLDDLAEIVDDTYLRCERLPHAMHASGSGSAAPPPLPLILLGHSLGGLVASRFVSLNIRPVEGLIMSSPALDAGLGFFQKLLLAITPRVLPNLCVNNALEVRYLSHDARVVKAYTEDRLVHNRISARLGKFIATAGPATVKAAANWRTPTLLLYAGADHLVNPQGSRDFAENAANSSAVKRGTVTVRCFEGMYHELFNESRPAPVFEALKAWLDAKF